MRGGDDSQPNPSAKAVLLTSGYVVGLVSFALAAKLRFVDHARHAEDVGLWVIGVVALFFTSLAAYRLRGVMNEWRAEHPGVVRFWAACGALGSLLFGAGIAGASVFSWLEAGRPLGGGGLIALTLALLGLGVIAWGVAQAAGLSGLEASLGDEILGGMPSAGEGPGAEGVRSPAPPVPAGLGSGGKWLRVLFKGNSIRWPAVCACCLRPTDEALEVQGTATRSWGVVTTARWLTLRIPYCGECRAHVAWWSDLGIVGKGLKTVFVALVGTGVWSLVVWQVGRDSGPEAAPLGPVRELLIAAGGVVALALGAFYLRRQWQGRPAPLGTEHCASGRAVKVLSFKGDETLVALRSEPFARLAVRLNSGPEATC